MFYWRFSQQWSNLPQPIDLNYKRKMFVFWRTDSQLGWVDIILLTILIDIQVTCLIVLYTNSTRKDSKPRDLKFVPCIHAMQSLLEHSSTSEIRKSQLIVIKWTKMISIICSKENGTLLRDVHFVV